MTQVHKETLTTIDNALPNRAGLDVEIFGMEGIPEDVVASHNQRVLTQFAQAEAERRAATGNPGPGGAGGNGVKKPKFESPTELKKRLAEHKAKKAAEQNAGFGSGDDTPNGAVPGSQSPGLGQSPVGFVGLLHPEEISKLKIFQQAGSPGYPQQPMQYGEQPMASYGAPPSTSPYPSFSQPYGQPPAPYQQQPTPFPQQTTTFAPPGITPTFPNSQPYAPPPQQYQPPSAPTFPTQFQNGPQQYTSASPPAPFQHGQYQPPPTHTPPQNALPVRLGSLPPAPGLPQRPSFGAPPVNAFQMAQMHQGQLPGPSPSPDTHNQQPSTSQAYVRAVETRNGVPLISNTPIGSVVEPLNPNLATVVPKDDIPSVTNNAEKIDASMSSKAEAAAEEGPEEKKGKKEKEKDKSTKLVYSDNEVSPEEKMAQLPRYAFSPDGKKSGVLGGATTAAVTAI